MSELKMREFRDRAELGVALPDLADLEQRGLALRRRRIASGVGALALAVVAGLGIAGSVSERPDASPTPANPGLTTPLVAPGSLLEVRRLGFHVEPVPGLGAHRSGWSLDQRSQSVELDWDHMALGVSVTVYYQGVDPAVMGYPRDDVSVLGAPGEYYAAPEPEAGGAWGAQLVWEYAPDSYAEVATGSGGRGNPDPELVRDTLVKVAEAVRPGGQAVRLPLRFDTVPSSLPDPATARLISTTGDGGWDVQLFQGGLGIIVGNAGGPADYGEDIQVRVGDTVRSAIVDDAEGTPAYPVADLRRMLREITVAPSSDESTWFDLRTALGG